MVEIPLKVKTAYDGRAVDKGLSGLQKRVAGIGNAMQTAFGAWITIEGLRRIGQAATATFGYQNALKGLETQTQVVGIASTDLLKSLQNITAGQISLANLTVSSNKAIALLGTEAIPQFEELAEVAAKASAVMGISVTQAFDDIVTGIGRQSRMILDNLGIIVSAEVAYGNYATLLGKTADALTDAEKKQAFLNETLDQAREKYGALEVEINPMQVLAAITADLSTAFVGLFTANIGGGVQSLTTILKRLTIVLDKMSERILFVSTSFRTMASMAVLGGLSIGLSTLIVRLRAMWLTLGTVRLEFRGFLTEMVAGRLITTATTERIFSMSKAFEGLSVRLLALTAQAAATAAVFAVLFMSYRNVAIEQKKLTDSTKEVEKAYNDLRKEAEKNASTLRDLNTVLNSVNDTSELTQEQIDFLKDRIAELDAAFPGMLEQMGYAITAEGVFADAAGTAVTELNILQSVIDQFDVSVIVNEAARATEALLLLSKAKIQEAIGPEPLTPEMRREIHEADPGLHTLASIILRDLGTGFRALQEGFFGGIGIAADTAYAELEPKFQVILDRLYALQRGEIPEGVKPSPRIGGSGGVSAADTSLELAKRQADQLAAKQESEIEALGLLILKTIAVKDEMTELEIQAIAFANALKEATIKMEGFGKLSDAERQIMGLAEQTKADAVAKSLAGRVPKEEVLRKERILQLDAIFEDFLSGMTKIFSNFAREIGDISKLFGGGAGGQFANQLLGLGGQAFGAAQFGPEGFAKGGAFASTGTFAGLGPDIVSSLAIGAAGFALNRLFGGDKPIEIDGIVDIRIVDIETRFLNFFNFKGAEGITYRSDFREVFESGMF